MLQEGSWQPEWRVVPFSIGHPVLLFALSKDGQCAKPVRESTTGAHERKQTRLLPDVGFGSCHLAALIHFHSVQKMAEIFQFTLITGVVALWEGRGGRVMRVKGRADWQPKRKLKHKTRNW